MVKTTPDRKSVVSDVSSLTEVLVLVVRLTSPVVDAQRTQDFLDTVTDQRLGIVTDEHVHGTVATDVFHEDAREPLVTVSTATKPDFRPMKN